ncbi:unnamed protein product [Amaranthus hypochondriacus]
MDDKPEACAECSRFCLSLHKSKLDPRPIVSSFFKVMLGNHLSKVLIVPPRFAKTIMELERKSTYLEDSTGQKWEVYLTHNNGSLAFQKGWHEFFVDHNIQLGDFLVFNYFKGSHFNVQIFDRSGCEKPMIFSKKDYQKNRAKITKDFVPKRVHRDSSNKKIFANKCTNSFMDSKPDVDVRQRKDAVHNVRKLHEIGEDVPRQETTKKRPKVVPITDMTRRNTRGNMCFQTPNTMLKADTSINDEADWLSTECVALPNDTVSRAVMPLKVLYPGQSVAVPHTSEFSSPTSCGKVIVEQHEYGENIGGSVVADNPSCDSIIISNNGDRDEVLYIEAPEHDLCDSLSAPEFKISCSVKTIVNSASQDEYEEEKVVWLVDQVGRIWPVMYNQRGKDKSQELHLL